MDIFQTSEEKKGKIIWPKSLKDGSTYTGDIKTRILTAQQQIIPMKTKRGRYLQIPPWLQREGPDMYIRQDSNKTRLKSLQMVSGRCTLRSTGRERR